MPKKTDVAPDGSESPHKGNRKKKKKRHVNIGPLVLVEMLNDVDSGGAEVGFACKQVMGAPTNLTQVNKMKKWIIENPDILSDKSLAIMQKKWVGSVVVEKKVSFKLTE